MSIETRSTDGRSIDWRNGIAFNPHIEPSELTQRAIEVWTHAFDYTEFHIGVFEFLSGAKDISLVDQNTDNALHISIPDDPRKTVKMGEIEMPYKEYVAGVMWAMSSTGGHLFEEHQWPLHSSLMAALGPLERELLSDVPKLKQELLDSAHELREQHSRPGGIRGARDFERRGTFRIK